MDHYNDKIHEIGQFILDKIDATGEHVGVPRVESASLFNRSQG